VIAGLVRPLLYPGTWTRRPAEDAGTGVPGLTRLWRTTEDGRVEAWFLPGDGVGPANPGPLVVFAHGNGELVDDWPGPLAAYRRMGLSVLLPEYRGYGRSAGRPSEAALVADALAFRDQVVDRPEVDPRRVILHGRSLGGGVACGLARARPPAALVLQSTFTRVPDVAARWGVPRRWHADVYDNEAVVGALEVPVFLVHGTEDRLVPASHAEALARAAGPRAELHLLPGPHDPFPSPWTGFFAERLAPFVRRVLGDPVAR